MCALKQHVVHHTLSSEAHQTLEVAQGNKHSELHVLNEWQNSNISTVIF